MSMTQGGEDLFDLSIRQELRCNRLLGVIVGRGSFVLDADNERDSQSLAQVVEALEKLVDFRPKRRF